MASTMAAMMELLKQQAEERRETSRERENERLLRQQQLENQTTLTRLLEKRFSQPAADTAVQKGKVMVVPPRNSVALAQAGIILAPQYAMVGDLSTIDMGSNKNKIKSG